MPTVAKLVRMVTYLDGLLPIKSYDPFITCSCNITWQTKMIISSLTQFLWPSNLAMVMKMVICLDELLPIKTHDPLIACFCKVT